jgi:predicted nucleotidyltransferase
MDQQKAYDDALKEADALIHAAPDFAPGFLVRFSVRRHLDDAAGAKTDLCTAQKLGSTQAREILTGANQSCE